MTESLETQEVNGSKGAVPAVGVSSIAPPSLKRLAIRGSMWTIAGYGSAQVLRLGSNLVLTRLLFPEAFGLMALVHVFMQGLQMFSDIGIGPGIIRDRRGNEPTFLNTAWTIQVARGCALWVCSCLIAAPVARLYAEPMLGKLLPVAGLTALISGFNATSLFTLNRKLRLGLLTLVDLATSVFGIVVMIAWAYVSPSVWALVAGGVGGTLLRAVCSHMLPGVRNRFHWNREAARALFRFGRWIFISTLLTFLGGRIDRLLLGRLIPMAELGVYSIAMTLALLPVTVIASLSKRSVYPSLAQIARNDPAALARKVRKVRGLILAFGILVVTGLAVCSPAFFTHLYDPRYHAAGWIAQLLTVPVWFSVLQMSADRALLAVGDSRSLALSNLCKMVVTALACLVGHALAGLPGFILGTAAGALAGHVVVVVALARRGIPLLRQDLAHTAAVVGVGLAGALGPELVAHRLNVPPEPAGTIAAAAVLAAVGIPVLRRMIVELR